MARAALHSHISRLRGHLGPAASQLELTPGGYRLVGADGDAVHARSLLSAARELADPVAAAALLRQARGLWRGPALADLVDTAPMAAWSVTVAELHREIGDQLIRGALDVGEAGDVEGLATEALAEDPLREPAVLLLMRALAGPGGWPTR